MQNTKQLAVLFLSVSVVSLYGMKDDQQDKQLALDWNEEEVAFDFWFEESFLGKEPKYFNALRDGVGSNTLKTSDNRDEKDQYRGFSFYTETENKEEMLMYPSPSWMYSEIVMKGAWKTMFALTFAHDPTFPSLAFKRIKNKEDFPKALWPNEKFLPNWKTELFTLWKSPEHCEDKEFHAAESGSDGGSDSSCERVHLIMPFLREDNSDSDNDK